MSAPVLIAYATKHGSTAEIAEAIGADLRAMGCEADVRPVDDVNDLGPYDTVVVGSAVYHGRWRREALDFLGRFERDLETRRTWLFSSGPTGGTPESDAKVGAALAREAPPPAPADVRRTAERIRALGHETFGGRIGDGMTGFLERWMPRGDWRDFGQVRAWARMIRRQIATTVGG